MKSVIVGTLAGLATVAASASCAAKSGSLDCGRGETAGGTGTYADPLTFATAPGEFSNCQIIYLPYLKKYLRMEDHCDKCTTDYKNGKKHIDIWTGSATVNGGTAQLNCEEALTSDASQTVVVNPPTNLPVNTGALFSSGSCHTSNTYPNPDLSSVCSASSSGSSGSGSTTCGWEGHCPGASCSSDSDCWDQLTCSNGVCADTTCTWTGHCDGDACSNDNDCEDPYSCQSGVCALNY